MGCRGMKLKAPPAMSAGGAFDSATSVLFRCPSLPDDSPNLVGPRVGGECCRFGRAVAGRLDRLAEEENKSRGSEFAAERVEPRAAQLVFGRIRRDGPGSRPPDQR